MEWVTVLAILLAPVIAVQVTLWVEERRQARRDQLAIFKTLMATRATPFDQRHVEALNQIDVVFNLEEDDHRAIRSAWNAYLDHLNVAKNAPPAVWGPRRVELLVDLLYLMAGALGYTFDKTHIKNQVYYPGFYSDYEADQWEIRKGLVEIVAGRRAIVIAPQPAAPAAPAAAPPAEPGPQLPPYFPPRHQ